MTFEVAGAHPFVFRDTLFAHGWLRLKPFRWDEEEQALVRVEALPSGRVVALRITSPAPDGLEQRLRVEIEGNGGAPDARERPIIAERVRWMFGVDEDLTDFHAA